MTRLPTPPGAAGAGESMPNLPPMGGSDEGEKTFSLMGGVARPEGLPEADAELGLEGPRAGGRGVSSGTLLLLAVLVVAGGSLYTMRATQGSVADDQSKDAQTKIEQYLARLTQPQALAADDPLAPRNMDALFQDTDAIVAMLSVDPSRRQLPIDYVQKNPFILAVDKPVVEAKPGQPAPTQAKPKVDLVKKRLEDELRGLRLTSVMGGPRSAAIISGQVVQIGQKIGSFTVKAINPPLSIELEAEGHVYPLAMDSGKR